MIKTKLLFGLLLVTAFSCKKETVNTPINQENVNKGLDCNTCISSLLSIEIPSETIETCDDFTNLEEWPTTMPVPDPDEIIGHTQDGTYPVYYAEGDFASINETTPGIYGAGLFTFSMSGENQTAIFEVYGYSEDFTDMYTQVNGSEPILMSGDFPVAFGDLTIDFEVIAFDEFHYGELKITGNVESVNIYLFETGITELCVYQTFTGEPIIGTSEYISFADFYDFSGSVLGSPPDAKTPLGHYGLQATSFIADFEAYMGTSPNKIGFVHAYPEGTGSNFINVQLPNTPLIVTVPDSLNNYLAPYGYSAVNHHSIGLLWENETDPPQEGAQVDSIIITGNNLSQVTLGANLQESEIRSICAYYEQ